MPCDPAGFTGASGETDFALRFPTQRCGRFRLWRLSKCQGVPEPLFHSARSASTVRDHGPRAPPPACHPPASLTTLRLPDGPGRAPTAHRHCAQYHACPQHPQQPGRQQLIPQCRAPRCHTGPCSPGLSDVPSCPGLTRLAGCSWLEASLWWARSLSGDSPQGSRRASSLRPSVPPRTGGAQWALPPSPAHLSSFVF